MGSSVNALAPWMQAGRAPLKDNDYGALFNANVTQIDSETPVASINGIAHIQLTVSDMETSVPFYRTLLTSLEMEVLIDRDDYFYCIGGRTGIAIAPSSAGSSGMPFDQNSNGLHHFSFRARSNEDVDAIYKTALSLGAKIIRAPRMDNWAPGYYSVLFEDPDGIRIEANFVPGKGHLKQENA